MSQNKLKIAVIGATGFVGLDLTYLLSKHKKIKVNYLCATRNVGKPISFFDKRISKKLPASLKRSKMDLMRSREKYLKYLKTMKAG